MVTGRTVFYPDWIRTLLAMKGKSNFLTKEISTEISNGTMNRTIKYAIGKGYLVSNEPDKKSNVHYSLTDSGEKAIDALTEGLAYFAEEAETTE